MKNKSSNDEALVQKMSGPSSLVRTTNSYNLGARITFLMSLNQEATIISTTSAQIGHFLLTFSAAL